MRSACFSSFRVLWWENQLSKQIYLWICWYPQDWTCPAFKLARKILNRDCLFHTEMGLCWITTDKMTLELHSADDLLTMSEFFIMLIWFLLMSISGKVLIWKAIWLRNNQTPEDHSTNEWIFHHADLICAYVWFLGKFLPWKAICLENDKIPEDHSTALEYSPSTLDYHNWQTHTYRVPLNILTISLKHIFTSLWHHQAGLHSHWTVAERGGLL